jgi:hypothetical protein
MRNLISGVSVVAIHYGKGMRLKPNRYADQPGAGTWNSREIHQTFVSGILSMEARMIASSHQ